MWKEDNDNLLGLFSCFDQAFKNLSMEEIILLGVAVFLDFTFVVSSVMGKIPP